MNIITVPIRVDALVADKTTTIVKSGADFSKLPYQDANHIDRHPDTASLVSSISHQPFNNQGNLAAGVHLHWAMPDALTQGEVSDSEDQPEISLPPVPNRWLVIRRDAQDTISQQWVVESDYLYPRLVTPERAVCIPAKTRDLEPGDPPYRYLGRQVEWSQWREDQTAERYPNLNVLGWGNFHFSSLYAECFSVFGCYDDAITRADQVQGCSYEVLGWYADGQQDYVKKYLLTELKTRQQTASKKAAEAGLARAKAQSSGHEDDQEAAEMAQQEADQARQVANFRQVVEDIADWRLDDDVQADGMLCYGRIQFTDSVNLDDGMEAETVKMALAPSSQEAVSTYLSKQLATDEDDQIRIENQLQAVILKETVQGENVDFINQLKIGRHKAGFSPVDGGFLWAFINDGDITLQPPQQPPANAQAQSVISQQEERQQQLNQTIRQLKDTWADQLQALNHQQDQVNQLDFAIESQRELLFADWSKYMLCLYPADRLNDSAYPDSDLVKHLIESKTLPLLDALETSKKHLQHCIDDQLAALRQALEGVLKTYRVQMPQDSAKRLNLVRKIAAPRYWQVNEPTLLINGAVARPTDRHGADGVLACLNMNLKVSSIGAWASRADRVALPIAAGWKTKQATRIWTRQPWNPIMMDWEVALYPEQQATQQDDDLQSYNPDFIKQSYRVPLNDKEFALPSAAVDMKPRSKRFKTKLAPNIIKGCSLLSAGIQRIVQEQLKEYLDDKLAEKGIADFAQYQKDNPGASFMDPLYSIGCAHKHLAKTYCLSQQLVGLHDVCLMQRSGLNLPALDPHAFINPGQQSLTHKIRQRLGHQSYKLPVMGNRFIPIRSGISQLNQVRLVDTFGRFKDLPCRQLLRPQRQLLGSSTYLPPRLLQPVRLNLRWHMLPRQRLQQLGYEGRTPVCGWLLYNHFDETLVIYNTNGRYLGAINSDGEWQSQYDGNHVDTANIADPTLKALVEKIRSFHNRNRGKPNGRNYLPQLKQALRRAQDNIDPQTSNLEQALMSGQPMALVRASLDLQLKGLPETSKSWQALAQDLRTSGMQRAGRGFTAVKFPFKLGEYRNLDDGLICYWTQNEQGKLSSQGYFPQSDMDDVDGLVDAANFNPQEHDYIDAIKAEGVANLHHSLEDPPLDLVILMEPDAPIHATTGILPKKTLRLEPAMYRDALRVIQQSYFAAPLLTPRDQYALPLPKGAWCWNQRQLSPKGAWLQLPNVTVMDQRRFRDCKGRDEDWNTLVQQAILKPDPKQPHLAYYFPPAEQPPVTKNKQPLFTPAQWTSLEHILRDSQCPSIHPVDQVAPLQGRVKSVEGYFNKLDLPA